LNPDATGKFCQDKIGRATHYRWLEEDTSIVNNFTETVRKYPNIPTIPASAAIGSDVPEFVVPNLVSPPEPTSVGGATASHARQ
jgi:hypothetical protein